MFAAILAVSWGAISQHSPKQWKPIEKKQIQDESINQKANQHQLSPKQLNKAYDADCRNCEPEKNWWEKLWTDPVATFTGLLAFITAGLIYVGVRQELHLRDTARKELRAYLCIRNAEMHMLPTGVLRAFVEIFNAGKTPAHKVHPAMIGEMRAPSGNKFFGEVAPMPHRQPIAPGSQWSIGYEFNDASADDVRAVRADQKLVYMWGCIKYEDIFQKPRELRFRLRNVVKQIRPTEQGIVIESWHFYPEDEGNEST